MDRCRGVFLQEWVERRSPSWMTGAVALLFVGVAAARAVAQQPAAAARPLVFDGVIVVDVTQGKLVPNQRVVIAGNRIRAVGDGRAVALPKGAQIVDGRGKYLIPGLWDMHTHSAYDAYLFYPLFLANGITGIRDAGSPVPLDTMIQWRREIVAGTRIGPPRQLLSGSSILGPRAGCDRSKRRAFFACVADSADALHYIDSIRAAGADMIKPWSVERPLYFVIAAAARRLGIPFGGHAHNQPGMRGPTAMEASDSGAAIIDHMGYGMGPTPLDERCALNNASVEQCRPVAEQFQRHGTWVVPSVWAFAPMQGAGTRRIAERLRAFYVKFFAGDSLRPGNWLRDTLTAAPVRTDPATPTSAGHLHIAQQVGLPILAGTDIDGGGGWREWKRPPGFVLHGELACLVAEGLSPLEALRSATLNPAKMWHGTDSMGTVAPGKLADLVLLDADPLADITNTTTIRAVVANGRYFDRRALDQILADVRAKATPAP